MVSLIPRSQQGYLGAAFLGLPLLLLKAELVGAWHWSIAAAEALRLEELQPLNYMRPVWCSTEGRGKGAGCAIHEGRSSLSPKNPAKAD